MSDPVRRLAPGDRVYMSGYKPAHIIRSVDRHLAYPWCSDVDEIALLAVVDGSPEAPKMAPESMPLCVSCLAVLEPAAGCEPWPGALIREKRLDRGWTQGDLLAVLRCSRDSLVNVEQGRSPVSASLALRLEAAFDVPALEWLRLQNLVDLERARRVA